MLGPYYDKTTQKIEQYANNQIQTEWLKWNWFSDVLSFMWVITFFS
jgi:hypothetical protein